MSLSNEQINNLLSSLALPPNDELDCDGCFERIAEFAEVQLEGRTLPEALVAVKTHLECCPCCQGEYQALLEALQSLNQSEP